MIRFRFGVGILAVLLAMGIAAVLLLGHIHVDICDNLQEAAKLAAEERLEDAVEHIGTAQKNWENHRHWVASLAEHTDIEEIDKLFRQLEIYRHMDNPHGCAAICAELSYRVEALGESHNISWWNLL